MEHKPKGLVDALSNFFTPGLKRTSRTAINSLLKPEKQTLEQSPEKMEIPHVIVEENLKQAEEKVEEVVNEKMTTETMEGKRPAELDSTEEVKKVRLSVDAKEDASDSKSLEGESERKRHASTGQQQVKSLYDGLSHLYTDCDSRLRSVPMTNYDEKRRGEGAGTPDGSKGLKSPPRMASPHRMSDTELKEKEKADQCEKTGEKTEVEKTGEKNGNSKNQINYLLCTIFNFSNCTFFFIQLCT